MRIWNMTADRQYEREDINYLDELMKYLSLDGQREAKILDSHYDMLIEKWYFYIRVQGEHGYNIYQAIQL